MTRTTTFRRVRIDSASFAADPHAAKYRDVIDRRGAALHRVFAILNDPQSEHDLLSAARLDLPALQGVVDALEADDVVTDALASDDGQRVRQAIGVAVRLKMEVLGWSTTGRKGPIRGEHCFSRAERYQPMAPEALSQRSRSRARAGLARVATMGDEEEQAESAAILMAALAETRRAAGRPF